MKVLLTTTLALASSLFAASSFADAGCIDDKAKQVFACTGTKATIDTSSVRAGSSFHAALPPPRTAQTPAKPPAPPSSDKARDDRKIRLEARERKLLIDEVLKVESLFGTTRKNAPDRAPNRTATRGRLRRARVGRVS